jgi:polyether ionophore transport system permease protein
MMATTVAGLTRTSPISRIYGLGSIYAKTTRDSRLAFIIVAGLLGGLSLFMGAAISNVFPTPASRLEVDKLIGSMPAAMVNLFGKPEKLGTLGGYMSWKYGATFALATALWSILALSGTLAGEAAKGSLDLVATTPFGKRRIAIEKLTAHLTVLGLAMAIVAIMTTVSSNAFGDPALGDQIAPISAVGFALWVGFLALFFGGIAWVLAPILGRAGSAGVAGIALAVLWVANGLNTLGPVADLSPFRWTANHIPLVAEYDWGGLALVGLVAAAFLVIGVEVFARRDLGITAGLGLPTLPADVLGVRGPLARAFGEQLPRALSWGIGLGLFGAVLASLVGPMSAQIANDPSLATQIQNIFPTFDLASAGGFLQLYVTIFYIAAGFAAATFVSKWASDETGGRLEEILATPLTRARWVVSGAIAGVGSVVVMMLVFASGIGLGAGSGSVDASKAMLGSASLGLYAIALIGVGIAIGGLWRTSLAAEIVALLVVATYLVDLLAPPLNLPDWVHQLALTAHYGQPMIGQWDAVGIVASLVIAVAGTAIGVWGIRRRDIGR